MAIDALCVRNTRHSNITILDSNRTKERILERTNRTLDGLYTMGIDAFFSVASGRDRLILLCLCESIPVELDLDLSLSFNFQ